MHWCRDREGEYPKVVKNIYLKKLYLQQAADFLILAPHTHVAEEIINEAEHEE